MPSTPTEKSTGFLYSWTAALYLLQRHRLSKPRRPVLLWALRYSAFYAIIQAFANFDVWIISMDVVVAWITFPFNLFSRFVLVFSNFVVFFFCFLTCSLFYFFLVWNALWILGFNLVFLSFKKIIIIKVDLSYFKSCYYLCLEEQWDWLNVCACSPGCLLHLDSLLCCASFWRLKVPFFILLLLTWFVDRMWCVFACHF